MTRDERSNFVKTMFQFVENDLNGRAFVGRFIKRWQKDRDAQLLVRETWDQPYDQQLQAELFQNKISKEEFTRRWEELWGHKSDRERQFADMIDRVFTACDVFVDEKDGGPREKWELDEDQLRVVVAKELTSYIASRPKGRRPRSLRHP